MQSPAVKFCDLTSALLSQSFEKFSRPVHVAAVRARADQLQGHSIRRQPCGEFSKLGRIFLGRKIAPASPRLITDAPETYLVRIAIPVLHSLGGPRRQIRGSVAVLEPFEKNTNVAAPDIRREVWIRTDHFAKRNELIGSEVIALVLLRAVLKILVRLRRLVFCICPEIDARRTLISRTDTITPIVLIRKAAARISDHPGLEFFQIVDKI